MLPGQSFQNASASVVSKFANKGIILQPATDEYDPLTGFQSLSYTPHHFEYVTVDNKTLEKDSVNMVAGSRQSVIWFTFPEEIVDSTWGVLPSDAPGVAETTVWTDYFENVWFDEINEKWIAPYSTTYPVRDIVQLEKVIVNDIIVGYYALLEYTEN
ncbi:MAG: hypothetical protein DRP58_07285 [Spirochaetes bacterium]|nr:MAG: hypothetical protein DRP58_07285 [Spirochaetota bacterium]